MLQPKKTKYRRPQKGRMKSITKRGAEISFGSFAIKTLDQCWISARQIEAARQAITREMKREGQLSEFWAARVSPGRILFEADGIPLEVAKEAMRLGAQKLPVHTKFIVRRDYSPEI